MVSHTSCTVIEEIILAKNKRDDIMITMFNGRSILSEINLEIFVSDSIMVNFKILTSFE
jgi:hypothetical protein